MQELFIKAGQLILSLSLLVVLHELGHFIPAKLFKTKVEKFFLFFDVKFALFKKKIGETTYGIGWLPLGGYVKIAGMIDESMDKAQMAQEPKPWEFRSKPAWQRLIIMTGGVIVNIIVGFSIYIMILFIWGSNQIKPTDIPQGYTVLPTMQKYGFKNGDIPVEINGKPLNDTYAVNRSLLLRGVERISVKRGNEITTLSVPKNIGNQLFESGELLPFVPSTGIIVGEFSANSPAKKAGIKQGDEIKTINGEKVAFYTDFIAFMNKNKKDNISVEVIRKGQTLLFEVPLKEGKMGVYPQPKISKTTEVSYSFSEAITEGISYGYWTLHDYAVQFKYVFTKKGASQVGGFASMAKLFGTEWDWKRFWETTAMLSMVLAFMNILPIPALDGGHTVFLLYEIITGRKPSEKVLEYAQIVGVALILGLMLYANGNDLYKWILNQLGN